MNREIIFQLMSSKTISVRATFFNHIHHLPLVDDMVSGIASALTKLLGEVGSAMIDWEILADSVKLIDQVDLLFDIRLTSKSIASFASALCLVKAFGFERVSLRVLSIV